MNDKYKIAFSMVKGLTTQLADNILDCVGDEERFFSLDYRDLSNSVGFNHKIFDNNYRSNVLDNAEKELEFINQHKISVFYYKGNQYPTRLLNCEDAPLLLYCLGDCNLNSSHIISIVGTRHATPYGNNFVSDLIKDLASKLDNVIIVSGLAYGIDSASHNGAIKSDIPTVGVLAHGLTTVYPSANRNLAKLMIEKGGMLLTEYTSTTPIHKGNFLARNRIVAGISDCTIVIESAKKGGSLTTARLAAGYCRDVFALPGRISDKYSQGCNHLISNNIATLFQSADDLISAMGWRMKDNEIEQPNLFNSDLDETERLIVEYLSSNSDSHINDMCVRLNIPIGQLTASLINLEFKGCVMPYPGGKYRLKEIY